MKLAQILTNEEISTNKEEIINLLKSTKREGIENVINFLDKSGYYHFRASGNHHNYKGGLAEHSLGVCKKLLERGEGIDRNSIILSALLHDVGKLRYDEFRETKGHGVRSSLILKDLGLELTEEERLSIAYHTKRKRPHFYDEEHNLEYDKAVKIPLRNLLNKCDILDASKDD